MILRKKKLVFGIDLGTTNTCIAGYIDDQFQVLSIDNHDFVPSVVAKQENQWIVGQAAKNLAKIDPLSAVLSVKRKMDQPNYKFLLANQEYNPVEISAQILKSIKEKVYSEHHLRVNDVVITVPAWFNDQQRQATMAAGKAADLNIIRIINEPTAASLSYDVLVQRDSEKTSKKLGNKDKDSSSSKKNEKIWCVYDLGGGTFDVSVVSVKDEYKEVLSSCGNSFLGGDDFDQKIITHLLDIIKNENNQDLSNDPIAFSKLKTIAEDIKIQLSEKPTVLVNEFFTIGNVNIELSTTLVREQFEQMIAEYIDSTINKILEALDEAKVKIEDIDKLILVGGSTRIPIIKEKITKALGIIPDGSLNLDTAVALGACVQAAIIQGLHFDQMIVDISPHTLGVAALGEKDYADIENFKRRQGKDPLTFVPLIYKSSRLPATFTKELFTLMENQRFIHVSVYQGSSEYTTHNNFIGSFEVKIPPMPASSPVYIKFYYDLNGIVHISVLEKETYKVLKDYTMDLHSSSRLNTEKTIAQNKESVDDFIEIEGKDLQAPSKEAVNFLINEVDKKLKNTKNHNSKETKEIEELVQKYKKLLQEENNEEIDAVEDRLYAWVEGSQK